MGWLGPRALCACVLICCAGALAPLVCRAGESVDIPASYESGAATGPTDTGATATPASEPAEKAGGSAEAKADDSGKDKTAAADKDKAADESEVADSGPSVIMRSEFTHGELSQTMALVSPDIEVWDFGFGTEADDIEVGRHISDDNYGKLNASLYGYVAWYRQTDDWYIEPYTALTETHKKDTYTLLLTPYIPLNGGPAQFLSDGSSYYHQATKTLAVGLDSYVFAEKGVKTIAQWGPGLKITGTGSGTLLARALLWGGGDQTYRVEFDFH